MNESNLNETYGTLSETLNGLIKLGYTNDFNVIDECIVCHQSNMVLSADDFQIDKVYRFEGASDPDCQSILYAISSNRYNVKGTLVNGYGISYEEVSSKLIEKLQTNKSNVNGENKYNDATPQRPEGNRALYTPMMEMNLYDFIEQIKNEATWSDSDHNSVTIYKSGTLRLVLIGMQENAELKPHKANSVMIVQVLEGKIDFIAEKQSALLEKGQMIALKENITHSVKALTESFFLLTLTMKSNLRGKTQGN